MKTCLKKFAIGLAVLGFMTAGTAVAQNSDNGRDWRQGPPSVEDMLARMSDALNLSDQQSVDLLVVLQQHAAERVRLHEETMALMGPEICEQRASAEEDILAILTPDQAEQFMAMKRERKANATERNRGRTPRGPDCPDYGTGN